MGPKRRVSRPRPASSRWGDSPRKPGPPEVGAWSKKSSFSHSFDSAVSAASRASKTIVLGAIHGAVDVVGSSLVPARGEVDTLHVDGFGVDDGEMES